jgi:hypothetical protein
MIFGPPDLRALLNRNKAIETGSSRDVDGKQKRSNPKNDKSLDSNANSHTHESVHGGNDNDEVASIVYSPVLMSSNDANRGPSHSPSMWFIKLEAVGLQDNNQMLQTLERHVNNHSANTTPGLFANNTQVDSNIGRDQENGNNDIYKADNADDAIPSTNSQDGPHSTVFDKSNNAISFLSMCSILQTICVALPDTGTSFISLPRRRWWELMARIVKGRKDCKIHIDDGNIIDVRDAQSRFDPDPSSDDMVGDPPKLVCSEGPYAMPLLPSLLLKFQGEVFTIDPPDYILPNGQVAIQPHQAKFSNLEVVILGDTFLRAVHTIFDVDNLRVGMVLIEHGSDSFISHQGVTNASKGSVLNSLYGILDYLSNLRMPDSSQIKSFLAIFIIVISFIVMVNWVLVMLFHEPMEVISFDQPDVEHPDDYPDAELNLGYGENNSVKPADEIYAVNSNGNKFKGTNNSFNNHLVGVDVISPTYPSYHNALPGYVECDNSNIADSTNATFCQQLMMLMQQNNLGGCASEMFSMMQRCCGRCCCCCCICCRYDSRHYDVIH